MPGSTSTSISAPNVTDCLVEVERIDSILVQSVVHRHTAGFDVIPAPDRPVSLDDVPHASLEALLYVLRQEYALVIIDMPPVWNSWTRMVLSNLDAQILVTQLTVPEFAGPSSTWNCWPTTISGRSRR